MEEPSSWRFAVKVMSLCAVWFTISAVNNIVGKTILTEFPYPMTISFIQLISIVVLSFPTLWILRVPKSPRIERSYFWKMIVPLAFGKAVSSIASHLSVLKVSLSYAHTVKATMPFFVVILSRLILSEKQTKRVYLSLIPIIAGVGIATVTELSFNLTGLISALTSTLGFAMLNIFSKKTLKETGMHHLRLLSRLSQIALMLLTPFWLYFDLDSIVKNSILVGIQRDYFNSMHTQRLVALLVIDGVCAFAQNIVAFTFIALVSSLSYAVANSSKRIVVIGFALATFRNPVTTSNVIGMGLAVSGVLIYNKAKYDQNQAVLRSRTLPYVRSESNLRAGLTVGKQFGMNNGYANHQLPTVPPPPPPPHGGAFGRHGFNSTTAMLRPSLLLQNDTIERRYEGRGSHMIPNNRTIASGLNRYT